MIEPVLERLAGVGLLDDVEFARAWLARQLGSRLTMVREPSAFTVRLVAGAPSPA